MTKKCVGFEFDGLSQAHLEVEGQDLIAANPGVAHDEECILPLGGAADEERHLHLLHFRPLHTTGRQKGLVLSHTCRRAHSSYCYG